MGEGAEVTAETSRLVAGADAASSTAASRRRARGARCRGSPSKFLLRSNWARVPPVHKWKPRESYSQPSASSPVHSGL